MKTYRARQDAFKMEICDFIFKLIEREPDLAGYDFGLGYQGSSAYITIRDPDKGMRTFHLLMKDTRSESQYLKKPGPKK